MEMQKFRAAATLSYLCEAEGSLHKQEPGVVAQGTHRTATTAAQHTGVRQGDVSLIDFDSLRKV